MRWFPARPGVGADALRYGPPELRWLLYISSSS